MRFCMSRSWSQRFSLTGCNANQAINPLPDRRTAARMSAGCVILTIPSATHRTTPGTAAAAVAVEAALPARRPKPSKEDRFPHATPLDPLRSPLAKLDPTTDAAMRGCGVVD